MASKSMLRSLTVVLFVLLSVHLIVGQTTGSISGTVVDQNGAVVPNATVSVKGEAGQQFTATTSDSGIFTIPAVGSGLYTATVTAPNFKSTVVQNIKVDVGVPATVDAVLQAGNVEETVVVTSGAEVLQTQTATVGTNIQGRQIIETPIQSRDALDLVTLLPGTNTVGTVRTSSINGLPKSAISITIDGVDVQDNYLRSSDGFFTYVRPRIDAIEEVTVSTAVPGAESSGDGAVQIKFGTRRGTNDYSGSLYWQHRDEGINANNFLNNRSGLPKQKLRLNQFGGRLGGPLPFLRFGEGGPTAISGRDRSFFFVNYERFHLNESSPVRERTILDPQAQTGLFDYVSGGTTRTVNVLSVAAANGYIGTADPTIAALLSSIRGSASGGVLSNISGDVNRQRLSFYNPGEQRRGFLALRFDVNITKNHSIENVSNYQRFRSNVDFLNSVDPAFPGFANAGTQNSERWSNSTALRSSFGQNIVNEARFSRLGGSSRFDLVGGTEFFTQTQAGFSLGLTAAGITNATIRNAFTSRTSPTYDFSDNVTWIAGSHTISLGGQYKTIKTITNNTNLVAPVVGFTANTTLDPIFNAVFNTTNFPGATAAQLAEANNLYNTLTGRITSLTSTAYLGADGRYVAQGPLYQEIKQNTFGLYAQDYWKIRPNLTVNFGLRWQPQDSPIVLTNNFTTVTDFNMIYDRSGPGNLFSPGTLTGVVPTISGIASGSKLTSDDRKNFAPSVGVVYSPDFESGILKAIFGERDRSVIRGGFSRAFVREGTLLAAGGLGINPGSSLSANRTTALNNITLGTYLRTGGNPNLTPAPFSATPTYPRTLTAADAAVAIVPNLDTGYVDSFTVGYQREIDRDTVIEFRYVGNRGKDMQSLYSLNEVNAIENGFGAEFALAQANLLANQAAGRGNSFAYFGAGTGTSPLPIFVSYIAGAANPTLPASYGALFSNATLVNALATSNPQVQGLASLLESNFRATGTGAGGRPVNFFNNCPTTLGFCFVIDNSETSSYDAGVIELRRRLSSGLRFQASYTFGKSFTNRYASPSSLSTAAGTTDQYNNSSVTLRNPDLDNSFSQIDLRHAFKFDATYDLPFGRGQKFFSNSNRIVDAILGGFTLVPVVRWQSGSPMLLENVQLVGMTVKDLQKAVKGYKNTTYRVPGSTVDYNGPTWLPQDIILNTIAAFNTTATGTGYSTQFGVPTGRFIAPAGYGNCQARYTGQCGFRKLVIYGPSFFKVDTTVIKRVKFDEKRNVELRATFFDVLNRTNFRVTGWTGNVGYLTGFGGSTFGQLLQGTTYQDPAGSNDPGGRLVDLSLRINF